MWLRGQPAAPSPPGERKDRMGSGYWVKLGGLQRGEQRLSNAGDIYVPHLLR